MQKISWKLSGALAVIVLCAFVFIPSTSAAGTSDGQIVVTLSQNPKSPATVTATRGGAVPPEVSSTGQEIPPETITLTLSSGPHATYKVYSSNILPYSGYSQAPDGCRDDGGNYENWKINVSGSATGTGSIRVACGGVQNVNINVTPAGQTNPNGTIAGNASSNGNNCNSNSTYKLVQPGQGSGTTFSATDPGTKLPIANGAYTISNVNPGTYDVVIDCLYNPGGSNVPSEAILVQPNVVAVANQTTNVDITQGAGGSGTTTDTCPLPDGGLRWVLCPLFTIGQDTLQKLDGLIQTFLEVDINSTFSNSMEAVFGTIRGFGISLIVVAGLIMVISQAAGLELLSAYTIRKLLPRLVIAIIGMAIAWPLLKFLVGFFNDLGNLIQSLLLGAVNSTPPAAGNANDTIFTTVVMSAFGGVAVVGGAIIAGLALGIAGLMTVLGTGILALLVGLAVLSIRQLVIMVCVILAPLAIAASVIPGTQSMWQFWRKTLISTLVMFPIIMGFLGAGKAMSFLIFKGTNVAGQMQILALIVYFAPYFMLPFAFRMAGGLMANVSGVVQNRAQAPRKWLAGRRQAAVSSNWSKMKAGDRIKWVPGSDKLNALTRRATTKYAGFGVRGRSASAEKATLIEAEAAKSARAQARQFDDDQNKILTYGSAAEAKANAEKDWGMSAEAVDDAIKRAKANGGFGKTQQRISSKFLAASGTGYKDMKQMNETIARVSGGEGGNGDEATSLIGELRGLSERASRHDLKGSFSTMQDMAHRQMGLKEGGAYSDVEYDQAVAEGSRGFDAATLARGKPQSVENISKAVANTMKINTDRSLSMSLPTEKRDDAAKLAGQMKVQLDSMQDASFYSTPQNTEKLADVVNAPRTQSTLQVIHERTTEVEHETKTVAGPDGAPIIGNDGQPVTYSVRVPKAAEDPVMAERVKVGQQARERRTTQYGGPDDPNIHHPEPPPAEE